MSSVLMLRSAGCDPIRTQSSSGPGAHREAAADRHHHHSHRALHHPADGGWDHAPHPHHGHRGEPNTAQEQKRHQLEQN